MSKLTVVRDRCFTAGYYSYRWDTGPTELAFEVSYPACTRQKEYVVKVWRKGNRSNVPDEKTVSDTKRDAISWGLSMARILNRSAGRSGR